jgi:hypothetical protein
MCREQNEVIGVYAREVIDEITSELPQIVWAGEPSGVPNL